LKPALVVLGKRTPKYVADELLALARVASYEPSCVVYLKERGGRAQLTDAKLKEIVAKAEECGAEVLLCGAELAPSDFAKLMKETKRTVVDRTLLLLEVFDKNAGSREARLQIETAMLKHYLPVLREALNLAKRGELPGFMSGGGYAIDKYYLHVKRKIAANKRKLEEVRARRAAARAKRREEGALVVAIVGFANAGKTTLFNALTGSQGLVGSTPFTTLSPKVSRLKVDGAKGSTLGSVLLVDTVGFVVNVPPEIVDAFYSTLEEVADADVVVLVVDAAEDLDVILLKLREAKKIMANIGAAYKPVFVVLNKVDVAKGLAEKRKAAEKFVLEEMPSAVGVFEVSASLGLGLDKLVEALWGYSRRLTSCASAIGLAGTRGSQPT